MVPAAYREHPRQNTALIRGYAGKLHQRADRNCQLTNETRIFAQNEAGEPGHERLRSEDERQRSASVLADP